MDFSFLDNYGIDAKSGIARCLNDESFYMQILELFLSDTSFTRAQQALENKDLQILFSCVHELKGACGNAGLNDLYNAVNPLVELLRSGSATYEQAASMFSTVEVAYSRAIEGILKVKNS